MKQFTFTKPIQTPAMALARTIVTLSVCEKAGNSGGAFLEGGGT